MKRQHILSLHQAGKSYSQIAKILNCSKSLVCYYCGQDQKQKTLTRQKINRQKQHPYLKKLQQFSLDTSKSIPKILNKSTIKQLLKSKLEFFARQNGDTSYMKPQFTLDDVIQKFGANPTCYLTGKPIDIHKPRTYEFDHIIPRSRGGDNSLDNLGLCSKQANQSKRDMTPDEFINLCKQVLENSGYTVAKHGSDDSHAN